MVHVAIMKKSWGLIPKILAGQKTVESRWYRNKCRPWGQIAIGNEIYFKDCGEPVSVKAKVTKVIQLADLTPAKTKEILAKYGQKDLGLSKNIPSEIKNYFKNKKYCLLVFFDRVQKIKPFNIDKTGFGLQSAWLTVEKIESIIKP